MYGAKLPSFHRTYETPVDTHVHLVHCRKPIIREVRPAVGFRQLSCQDLFNNHRYKHLKVNQIRNLFQILIIALKMLVHHTALSTSLQLQRCPMDFFFNSH